MADQVIFLLVHVNNFDKTMNDKTKQQSQSDPASVCNDKVLGLAQEWIMSILVGGETTSQRHLQDRQQTLYARLLSVGKSICFFVYMDACMHVCMCVNIIL